MVNEWLIYGYDMVNNIGIYMRVSHENGGTPNNGWFLCSGKSHLEMDDD